MASCNNGYGRWSCTSGDFLEYGLWPGPDYLELLSGNDIATDLEVVKSLLLLRTFRGYDFAWQASHAPSNPNLRTVGTSCVVSPLSVLNENAQAALVASIQLMSTFDWYDAVGAAPI
jgi:hypothetical protein